MEMSQKIYFWHQNLLKIMIFLENGKCTFGQKILDGLQNAVLNEQCSNCMKIILSKILTNKCQKVNIGHFLVKIFKIKAIIKNMETPPRHLS